MGRSTPHPGRITQCVSWSKTTWSCHKILGPYCTPRSRFSQCRRPEKKGVGTSPASLKMQKKAGKTLPSNEICGNIALPECDVFAKACWLRLTLAVPSLRHIQRQSTNKSSCMNSFKDCQCNHSLSVTGLAFQYCFLRLCNSARA